MRTRAALLAAGLLLAGCVTIGRNFSSTELGWIKAGQTTKQDVLAKLGDPFRVGNDQGDQTWTYGYYRYQLFGASPTKDLVLRFDAEGKVKSSTLNTSFDDEKESLEPALKK